MAGAYCGLVGEVGVLEAYGLIDQWIGEQGWGWDSPERMGAEMAVAAAMTLDCQGF